MRGRNNGVTLIELILVMGVLATLAAITVPRLSRFSKGREFTGEWNRFTSVLRYARSEAVARSATVELRFDVVTGAYRLVGSAWFEPLPSYAMEHFPPDGTSFRFSDMGAQQGQSVSVIFQPDGSVDPNSPREIHYAEDNDTLERVVQLDPVLGYKPVTLQ